QDAQIGEYQTIRAQLDIENEVLKQREKLVRTKKTKVISDLEAFFERIERGDPKREAQELHIETLARLDAIGNIEDPDVMGAELHRAEVQFTSNMEALRNRYRVARPRGIVLSRASEQDWAAYRKSADEIERLICVPVESSIQSKVAELLRQRG